MLSKSYLVAQGPVSVDKFAHLFAMALPLDLLWQQLYDEKRRVVERPDGSKVVTPDFATFQLAMQTMAVDYASKGLPKFLSKLYPKLEHIKSLQAAVSSMTQANMVSTLVWGALQIFLEVSGVRYQIPGGVLKPV